MSKIKPLIDLTAKELENRGAGWEEFSVVWGIANDGEANDSWGFWFATPASDPQAFGVPPWDVEQELLSYLDELYPGGNYPIRALLQFNRTTGRYNVDFEDSDTTRWQVTPANLDQAREALRPNLG